MTESSGVRRETATLAVGGALGFWVANFTISLTAIAAEYRAALSISYVPMLLQALGGGLVIGFGVGYGLLRYFDRIPTHSPVAKSLVLSGIAFVAVTIVVEVPAKLFGGTSDALEYFLIATAFNALRILALGLVIGFLYNRIDTREDD